MDPVTLAQAGPVAILLVGIGLLYRAFQRQDIVPGSLYRAAVERAEKAELQADRSTDAVEAMAEAVKVANERPGRDTP